VCFAAVGVFETASFVNPCFPAAADNNITSYIHPTSHSAPPTCSNPHHSKSHHTHSFAAAHRPSLLLPGANHTQTTAATPSPAQAPPTPNRGDVPATASDSNAMAGLGAVVAAFLTANASGVDEAARASAVRVLRGMSEATAGLVAPWFEASGALLGGDLTYQGGQLGGRGGVGNLAGVETHRPSCPATLLLVWLALEGPVLSGSNLA